MAMNAAEKARIAGRKEAVKAGVAKGQTAKEARKRYYVQTRVAELEKAGKPVSAEKRKQLRQKFNSGDVSRRGFAAPKKKVSSSSSSSSSVISGTPTAPSSKGRSATSNMKGVSGYKAGSSKSSSKSADSKKGRSGGGKVYDFARNELLGVDDFGRVGKNLRKGNYGKAAKSAGAGVLELGSSIATLFGVGAGAKGAVAAAKAAKLAKGAKGSRVLKGTLVKSAPKAITSGPKALGTGAKSAVSKAPKAVTRKPAVKKPVAKKPVAKKPVAKKVVAKKPAREVRRFSSEAEKKNYQRTVKNANAQRRRREAARKFPG